MRKEIREALERANAMTQLIIQMTANNTSSTSDIGEEDAKVVQDTAAPYKTTLEMQIRLFLDFLQQCMSSLYVYQSWSNSIDIKQTEQSSEYIIVSMTLYGPLAAVEMSGAPDREIIEVVQECIRSCGLIQLTDDQVDELYNTRQFRTLF